MYSPLNVFNSCKDIVIVKCFHYNTMCTFYSVYPQSNSHCWTLLFDMFFCVVPYMQDGAWAHTQTGTDKEKNRKEGVWTQACHLIVE